MSIAYLFSTMGLGDLQCWWPRCFAFGPGRFQFLGVGPVTSPVRSYGPVCRQRTIGVRALAD